MSNRKLNFMKVRTLKKISLSIICTFILTLAMIVVPSGIASATEISNQQNNSVEIECSPKILKSLENFVKDMGRTADAYTTLGITYLSCGNLNLAEKRFNYAMELAEAEDNDDTAKSVAQYGLFEIDFLSGKISKKERDALTEEIALKLPNHRGLKKIRGKI